MKIAVTTASGALGSAIVDELKKRIGKENVIGIARTPAKANQLDVEIRKGDYNSKDDFIKALKGVDAVLLVSGMDHPDNRIQQHRNVIEAARENGVSKIVYTSIMGAEEGNAFSPVVKSNRQTEEDIKDSGMNWAIGRNGLYIEPDLEYIEQYKKDGAIINCAGEGKCSYTSRTELAHAYFNLLTRDDLNGDVYNLGGQAISQMELSEAMNHKYGTHFSFKDISVEDYLAERKTALGDFIGTIIGGIYEGIRSGKFEHPSDFNKVCGREHKNIDEMIKTYLSTR